MSKNKLFSYFTNYLALNEKEKEALAACLTERRIKRRQFVLQEGNTCQHYTFVVEGCFKMYAIDTNGKEHNIQFAAENDWIADIGSFYSELPSKLFIEAVEPSIIIQITRPDLIALYTAYPKFNLNFRVIIENKFVELQNRVLQNISSTSEERYLYFTKHYPTLSNRLPNTQIASYLGITPEFLSRIRNNIISK